MYWLDPKTAIKDPELARKALSNALHVGKINVLVSQDAADDVEYVRLVERLMPELRFFDHMDGYPFINPRYPHLRFPIHTGWTRMTKEGFLMIRDFHVPAEGLLETLTFHHTINADTPLMGRFVLGKDGVPIGLEKPLTNKEVLENNEWPIYASILRREYINVEGKGVVF